MSKNLADIKIKTVASRLERCEVCHQADMFDPETQFCERCQHIALVQAVDEQKVNAAPLPEFLAKKLSANEAIQCTNCKQFIMSRATTCRHCGQYVRFEEAAQATQTERKLNTAYNSLQNCKVAGNLCWDFVRLHLWGFPLTILLTPVSALISLGLMVRAFLYAGVCFRHFSQPDNKADARAMNGQQEVLKVMGRSLGAFSLVAGVGGLVIVTGIMSIPLFWDSYGRGKQEFASGNYVSAERYFLKALDTDHTNLSARFYYARSIWGQYNVNAGVKDENNQEVAKRALGELRALMNDVSDLKMKDDVYVTIATIYKATEDRQNFERTLLERTQFAGQSITNQAESLVQIGIAYANDLALTIKKYSIKNSYPPAWQKVDSITAADLTMIKQSAEKALTYFEQALATVPEHDMALAMRRQIRQELRKVDLDLDDLNMQNAAK
jgi:tetratricopeptide (TPR) repeat protein